MKLRTDVPTTALPRRAGALPLRTDIAAGTLPQRGRSSRTRIRRQLSAPGNQSVYPVSSTTLASVVTEWVGRVAAVLAIVLFVLVTQAIHKGLMVQQSARKIVQNFHTANNYFATRADLNDPAEVRKELQTLQGVLTRLNAATGQDVADLAATLPNVRTLLAAGQGDVTIAKQLQGVGATLQGSAQSLSSIASDANVSVSSVNRLLTQAMDLVNELNAQLARTEHKLAALPATGGNAK